MYQNTGITGDSFMGLNHFARNSFIKATLGFSERGPKGDILEVRDWLQEMVKHFRPAY